MRLGRTGNEVGGVGMRLGRTGNEIGEDWE